MRREQEDEDEKTRKRQRDLGKVTDALTHQLKLVTEMLHLQTLMVRAEMVMYG